MSEPRVPQAHVSRRCALALWVCAAAGLYLVSLLLLLFPGVLSGMNAQVAELIYNLAYYLPFSALPLILCARKKPGIAASLRPNPISLADTLRISLLALVGVYFMDAITVLWALPFDALGFDMTSSGIVMPANARELALSVLTMAALPGVCEEFLFRGAIFSALEEGGTRRAVLFSALLFALMHGSLAGLPAQFLTGAVLALLTFSCDSVYAGAIYHTVHNAATLILNYISSAQSGGAVEDAAQAQRLIDSIGGTDGVVALLITALIDGAVLLLSLRAFRRRAQIRGVTPKPSQKIPLRGSEWALLIAGLLLCGGLYALDVVQMLHT